MNKTERKRIFNLNRFYPIIDPAHCLNRSAVSVLEAVLLGGAKIIQLRNKSVPSNSIVAIQLAHDFRALTNRFQALLIINDSIELALACDADGVHLGQTDLGPETRSGARFEQDQNLLVGISAFTPAEALEAEALGADYLGIGPVFPTKTKDGLSAVLGLEGLKAIIKTTQLPCAAIGGINSENAKAVLAAGASHLAIITAVTAASDPQEAAEYFQNL